MIISKVINVLILIMISVLLWFIGQDYPAAIITKTLHTFIALTIIYIIFSVFEEITLKSIKNTKTRYSFKKATSTLDIVISLIVLMSIWVENPETLLVTYGLIAAGVAIALQDFFRNFVGGVVIFTTGIYRVGDRIEISSRYGDVIDIGILYTTMMELRGWVEGDQASGRLTIVPNGCVLSEAVNNYTKDHSFIWDEIQIPITYDSDWKKAFDSFMSIIQKETKDTTAQAEKEISKLEEKYYLHKRSIEPAIFIKLTDNWIDFSIRYVTDVRSRRFLHSKLSRLILEEISKSKDIKIASETMEVSLSNTDSKKTKKI
ncbi:MAG: mechanosensitive ion channel domain-containing protein [archaeon]